MNHIHEICAKLQFQYNDILYTIREQLSKHENIPTSALTEFTDNLLETFETETSNISENKTEHIYHGVETLIDHITDIMAAVYNNDTKSVRDELSYYYMFDADNNIQKINKAPPKINTESPKIKSHSKYMEPSIPQICNKLEHLYMNALDTLKKNPSTVTDGTFPDFDDEMKHLFKKETARIPKETSDHIWNGAKQMMAQIEEIVSNIRFEDVGALRRDYSYRYEFTPSGNIIIKDEYHPAQRYVYDDLSDRIPKLCAKIQEVYNETLENARIQFRAPFGIMREDIKSGIDKINKLFDKMPKKEKDHVENDVNQLVSHLASLARFELIRRNYPTEAERDKGRRDLDAGLYIHYMFNDDCHVEEVNISDYMPKNVKAEDIEVLPELKLHPPTPELPTSHSIRTISSDVAHITPEKSITQECYYLHALYESSILGYAKWLRGRTYDIYDLKAINDNFMKTYNQLKNEFTKHKRTYALASIGTIGTHMDKLFRSIYLNRPEHIRDYANLSPDIVNQFRYYIQMSDNCHFEQIDEPLPSVVPILGKVFFFDKIKDDPLNLNYISPPKVKSIKKMIINPIDIKPINVKNIPFELMEDELIELPPKMPTPKTPTPKLKHSSNTPFELMEEELIELPQKMPTPKTPIRDIPADIFETSDSPFKIPIRKHSPKTPIRDIPADILETSDSPFRIPIRKHSPKTPTPKQSPKRPTPQYKPSPAKSAKKGARCPKGTRKDKYGNCVGKNAPAPPKAQSPPKAPASPKVPRAKTEKVKRCPNGYARNKKTGQCDPK